MKILEISAFILSQIAVFYILFSLFLPPRSTHKKRAGYLIFILVFWIIFENLKDFIEVNVIHIDYGITYIAINTLRYILLVFSVIVVFSEKRSMKVLLALYATFLAYIGEAIQQILLSIIIGPNNIQDFIMNSVPWVIPFFFQIILIIFIKAFMKKEIHLPKKILFLEIGIILLCLLAVSMLIESVVSLSAKGNAHLVDHLAYLLFIILMVFIYIAFEFANSICHKNNLHKLQEERHKYLELYYDELEKYQTEIRIMKHDMNNQLLLLRGHLKEKNSSEILEQINNSKLLINKSQLDIMELDSNLTQK